MRVHWSDRTTPLSNAFRLAPAAPAADRHGINEARCKGLHELLCLLLSPETLPSESAPGAYLRILPHPQCRVRIAYRINNARYIAWIPEWRRFSPSTTSASQERVRLRSLRDYRLLAIACSPIKVGITYGRYRMRNS